MKIIQSFVLAAIVLGTSACAGNDVKTQPTAVLIEAPSTVDALAASPIEPAQPSTSIAPSPQQATGAASLDGDKTGAVVNVETEIALPETSDQEATVRANAPEAATQAEHDADALYAAQSVRDPWEGFNRKMHGFNNVLDRFLFRPVAVGYDKVMPDPVQSGVSRFFANLRIPATAVNQALQGHPVHAGQSLGRFLVNTTVGVAGIFDPATRFGVPKRDGEDFGQTLATWGWRNSRYLVMPLLGPRTVRDTVGIIGDMPLSPIDKIGGAAVADKLLILQMVDGRSQMLPMDQMRRSAVDDYAFVRDAWSQRRGQQIEQDLKKARD